MNMAIIMRTTITLDDYGDNGNNNNNNNNNNNSVKTKVIPGIIRAIGTVSKSFRKSRSKEPEKHGIKELQKTVILSTSESATVKVQNIQHGN
jgi:hypothetical protein